MRLYYKEIYLKDNPCTQPRKGWPHLRGVRPILFPNCGVGFFYVPQFSSLSLKSRKSNSSLQMSFQRQHFLLSCLKTLSVGPAGV